MLYPPNISHHGSGRIVKLTVQTSAPLFAYQSGQRSKDFHGTVGPWKTLALNKTPFEISSVQGDIF